MTARKIGYFLMMLSLLLTVPLLMGAVLKPTEQFYVNDYADVLSQETEDAIFNASKELYDRTGAQVVVLTIASLDGKSIEDYGIETARSWKIGSANKNNGILILLSTGDREVRVEVGYGLEGCLNDAKAGRLIDEFAVPYYKDNNFAEGTQRLFYAVLNIVRQEYGLEVLPDTPVYDEKLNTIITVVTCIIVALISIVILIFQRGRRGFYGYNRGSNQNSGYSGRNSGGGGSFGGGGASRKF